MAEGFFGRIKGMVEWLEHGCFIVWVLLSLGAGKAVKAMLNVFTRIPPDWITPIWIFSSALVLWALLALGKRLHKRSEQKQTAQLQGAVTPSAQFLKVDEFYKTYDNIML